MNICKILNLYIFLKNTIFSNLVLFCNNLVKNRKVPSFESYNVLCACFSATGMLPKFFQNINLLSSGIQKLKQVPSEEISVHEIQNLVTTLSHTRKGNGSQQLVGSLGQSLKARVPWHGPCSSDSADLGGGPISVNSEKE